MRNVHTRLSMPLAGAVALLLLLNPSAHAGTGEVRELRFHPVADLGTTVGIGALWIGSEVDKASLAPERCRWCGGEPAIDGAARDAFRWREPGRAAMASDAIDFAALPVMMLGLDAILASRHGALGSTWGEDAVIIVQAAATAALLNQVVKLSAGRERPFVGSLDEEQKLATEHPSDNNLSFYSGHASLAFALVGATATVGRMRGYDDAWIVWPIGVTAAVAVGWLRMAADKHWFTDVATGAVVGSAIGVLMPALLHPPRRSEDAAAATVFLGGGGPRQPPVLSVAFAF